MKLLTLNINWGDGQENRPTVLENIRVEDPESEEDIERMSNALEVLYGMRPVYMTWEEKDL